MSCCFRQKRTKASWTMSSASADDRAHCRANSTRPGASWEKQVFQFSSMATFSMTFSRSFIIRTPPTDVFVYARQLFSCLKSGPERQPRYELDGNELDSNNLRSSSVLDHRRDLVHGVVRENLGGGDRATRSEAPARRHGRENDRQFPLQSRGRVD